MRNPGVNPMSLSRLQEELTSTVRRSAPRSSAGPRYSPTYRVDAKDNPWHTAAAYRGGSKMCDCGGWVECGFAQGQLVRLVLMHRYGCTRGANHLLGVESLSIAEWNASLDRRPHFSVAKKDRPRRAEEEKPPRPFKRKKDRLERHRRH